MRLSARKAKHFAKADRIRKELLEAGVVPKFCKSRAWASNSFWSDDTHRLHLGEKIIVE